MPKSSIDPIVARNLKAALELRGRSAYSVANVLGHQPNWLYMVLNGKKGFTIPSLREIARELEVPLSFLVDSPEDIQETGNQNWPDVLDAGQRTVAGARERHESTQEEQAKLFLEEATLAAKELSISLDYLVGLTDESSSLRGMDTGPPVPP